MNDAYKSKKETALIIAVMLGAFLTSAVLTLTVAGLLTGLSDNGGGNEVNFANTAWLSEVPK
jgi:hypothetical protein